MTGSGAPPRPRSQMAAPIGATTSRHPRDCQRRLCPLLHRSGNRPALRPPQPDPTQSDVDGEGRCTKAELPAPCGSRPRRRTVPDPAGARPRPSWGRALTARRRSSPLRRCLPTTPIPAPNRNRRRSSGQTATAQTSTPACMPTHATASRLMRAHLLGRPGHRAIARAKIDCTNIEPAFITATENRKWSRGVLATASLEDHAVSANRSMDAPEDENGEGMIGRAKLGPGGLRRRSHVHRGRGQPTGGGGQRRNVFWTSGPKAGTGVALRLHRTGESDGGRGSRSPKLVKTLGNR